MMLEHLLDALGYRQSFYYREQFEDVDISVAHLLREANRAGVRGTYFIRSSPKSIERVRPAVHVAAANTAAQARKIHKALWNQGATPFLLISLPDQVRVYSGFAYDDLNESVGLVAPPLDTGTGLKRTIESLSFLKAESIDSGAIWRQRTNLGPEKRVDRILLGTLRRLSEQLVDAYGLDREVAHALIGRLVYLHYLRQRDILSDKWLSENAVDSTEVFTENVRLKTFRRLAEAVDDRFNGNIFPIDWSDSSAPTAEAVRAAMSAFAGQDPTTGQRSLFRMFDFSFIPIELLSAIYEQFLQNEEKPHSDGIVYTPERLADYVISEVETIRELQRGMTILDPCCGSGIFLVLAYRRLIEQELRRCKVEFSPERLKQLLTTSIFGVERSLEASLVTEFSLILTLLSYIKPPELHEHRNFTFPNLSNRQIFRCDFFDDQSDFWRLEKRFDWIIGNPPWVELNPAGDDQQLLVEWIRRNQAVDAPVARFRTSEAFSWRVTTRLADNGVAGLLLQATSLTNDQSEQYRRSFFSKNIVHRVTNFANLAYILFESAEEPAASLVYSVGDSRFPQDDIVHFGPLIVNQVATQMGELNRRHAPWVITLCESEIQMIPHEEAAAGHAKTWKRALWGNLRDRRVLERLRGILSSSLGEIAEARSWHLGLGVQLRENEGSEKDPNRHEAALVGLKVLEPRQLRNPPSRLTVSDQWLVDNKWGVYVRARGGTAGLQLIAGPHLFLWNDFAAFDDRDFILRHPRLGLASPPDDADWLRAISVIWASSITPYFLFLDLSAGWGVSRSTIDLGDVKRMPMPNFTDRRLRALAKLHRSMALMEGSFVDQEGWKVELDQKVAEILSIPKELMQTARDFLKFQLPLVKGKAPRHLLSAPDLQQLEVYANRLGQELNNFLEHSNKRHLITVLQTPDGIMVSIKLLPKRRAPKPIVRKANHRERAIVARILEMAQREYTQWVYVRRSVRIFEGAQIHICKPARRLEWTQTQAWLDAADIIAEVSEIRGRT